MDGRLLPADRAVALSGLSFLREQRPALANHVNESLAQGVDEGRIHVAGVDARWYWHRLEWDSAYFGVPMIRLESAAWDLDVGDPVEELAHVAGSLRAEMKAAHGRYYVFAELPATDCQPLQALGLSGFRLVETRLTYFVPDTSAFDWPEHYPVRKAELGDMPHLRDVAASARNRCDRYHADPFFGDVVADRYLATYAEESVKGLADFIVVPDPGDGAPPGGFFTVKVAEPSRCAFGRNHVCPLDMGVGRIPLVAVGASRSGWHLRLLVETTRMLATRSVRVACMTTQATNRAVVRNCEKVGYRLGSVTHILAASHGQAR
jgi:dTDP-4-amino-4,6-dideoxy-D-galactose acyltransferase